MILGGMPTSEPYGESSEEGRDVWPLRSNWSPMRSPMSSPRSLSPDPEAAEAAADAAAILAQSSEAIDWLGVPPVTSKDLGTALATYAQAIEHRQLPIS